MGPLPEQFASSPVVRRRMQAIRSADTRPEMALRRAVHARGLRYQLHRRPVLGLNRKADIVFPRQRVAVFSDGCFWHGCPEHGQRKHEINAWYWPDKIRRNLIRDEDTNRRLAEEGWLVIRIWEHEDPLDATDRIAAAVQSRRITTA